ncbi:MAG: hypothetical protein V4732_10545 [Pseudomonadota bacterium]
MHTKTILKIISAAFISCMLAACGGGSSENGSALQNAINGTSSAGNSISTNASANYASSAIGQDTLQSMEFSGAIPEIINLKGTGGIESSLVRFRTLGQTGEPIEGIAVDFALTSAVGNIQLSQNSAVSNSEGYISTSVISGTVSTSIKVTATVSDNPAISTQSNLLVVATGLPDQKSMSLGLETFNAPGWGENGIKSKLVVQLADAYNNPASDGTAVSFTTEGGSIDASCTTKNGACTVDWTSQDPKPPRSSDDESIERILCVDDNRRPIADKALLHQCEAERAGRSTIRATAIGNESFKDQNSNGIFDPAFDIFATSETGECDPSVPLSSFEVITGACDDLAEAYLDSDESGTYKTGEPFINFITDTVNDAGIDNYTPHNGLYNGAFCQPADENNNLCSRTPITIRKQHMIVMSCDEPLVEEIIEDFFFLPPLPDNNFAIADCNGNALPNGTTVNVDTVPPQSLIIGNEYSWRSVYSPPGTTIKITVKTGSGTKVTSFMN